MTIRSDTSFPEPYAGREDDPGRVNKREHGMAYRCLTCGWHGKGVTAYDHHTENPAHDIILRDLPSVGPLQFLRTRGESQ